MASVTICGQWQWGISPWELQKQKFPERYWPQITTKDSNEWCIRFCQNARKQHVLRNLNLSRLRTLSQTAMAIFKSWQLCCLKICQLLCWVTCYIILMVKEQFLSAILANQFFVFSSETNWCPKFQKKTLNRLLMFCSQKWPLMQRFLFRNKILVKKKTDWQELLLYCKWQDLFSDQNFLPSIFLSSCKTKQIHAQNLRKNIAQITDILLSEMSYYATVFI